MIKIEAAWPSHLETAYTLILDIEQIQALASGFVPRVVQVMAEDCLFFRDKDEAAARHDKRRKKAG